MFMSLHIIFPHVNKFQDQPIYFRIKPVQKGAEKTDKQVFSVEYRKHTT